MLSKKFWQGAVERAVKTFAQAFLSVMTLAVGSDAIGVHAGLGSLDWLDALSVAAFATLYSFLTSVGNTDFVAGESYDA